MNVFPEAAANKDVKQKDENKKCNVCRKIADLMCDVCGDPYCSLKCQRQDFQKHRFICFPMPALITYRQYYKNTELESEYEACENCHKSTNICCAKCGFPCCSERCQNMYWEYHRYICAPMPKLVQKTKQTPNEKNLMSNGQSIKSNGLETIPNGARLQASTNSLDKHERNAGTAAISPGANKNETNAHASTEVSTSRTQMGNVNKNEDAPFNRENKKSVQRNLLTENAKVKCMGFLSTTIICVRPTSPDIDKHFYEILKIINEHGKSQGKYLKIPPKRPNFHALVEFDKEWHRAVVMDVVSNVDHVPVYLIDLGEIRVSKMQNMKYMPHTVNTLNCYTVKFQLKNVPHYKMTEKLDEYLSDYIGAIFTLKYAEPDANGGQQVELFVEGQRKSLNEKIIEFYNANKDNATNADIHNAAHSDERAQSITSTNSNASATSANARQSNRNTMLVNTSERVDTRHKPATQNNFKAPTSANNNGNKIITSKEGFASDCEVVINKMEGINLAPFKILKFEGNQAELSVTVVDYSNLCAGYIGCIPNKYAANLLEIQKFADTIKDDTPYKPKKREYCLAWFEDGWYRGKCNEVIGPDHFRVIYIDYTNEDILTSAKIRKYPDNFTLDCNTMVCLIRNFPKTLTKEQIKFASDYLDEMKFLKLKNVECLGAPIYVADCSDLVAKR